MAEDKRKTPRKTARRAAAKKRVPAKKQPPAKIASKKSAAKKSATKSATKSVAARNVPARKSVPIKKARVSKRALLPPLPPPGSARKTARGARMPSRAKTLARAKAGEVNKAICEIPACTEVVLRQKLRLAAPYIELWLTQKVSTFENETTPEAAFVRVWQWLLLDAVLEGSRVVITPDLVRKLFAEEMGHAPTF